MSGPRIVVSGVVRTWGEAERTGVNAAYVRSVIQAGGLPIVLSPLIGAGFAAAAMEGADALLLSGGEDIDPALYGETPSPLLGSVDRERDLFELALFAVARQRELPILGICRGLQLINVALGGTLWQDLASERPHPIDHCPTTSRGSRCHNIHIEPRSRAARALGVEQLSANSIHHQAIKQLAPGLLATAWSDDGLVEAVETNGAAPWLLAAQWHPEEMHADSTAPERGLFAALVQAAERDVTARR